MSWAIMQKVRPSASCLGSSPLTFSMFPGPFLFPEKKGMHERALLLEADNGISSWEDVYGQAALDQPGVKIITAAPDVRGVLDCIKPACERGVTVSIGHS